MFSLDGSTCWLLGAGASYDSLGNGRTGVPLTNDLIKHFFNKEELINLLTPLIRRSELHSRSFDELLGPRLNQTIDCIRSFCFHHDPQIAKYAAKCLRELIREIAVAVSVGNAMMMIGSEGISNKKGYDAENYGWLAVSCCMMPNWSVINMNYDCLLDWGFDILCHLDELPTPRQYTYWKRCLQAMFSGEPLPRREEHGLYLKLHGSLHLYSCQNEECLKYRQPFSNERTDSNDALNKFIMLRSEESCAICGEEALELILAPGNNLTQGEDTYLRLVFALAKDALIEAENWIVLGYSCPAYDLDVLNLLRDAMSKPTPSGRSRTVRVLSPAPRESALMLRDELSCNVDAYAATFSQLVSAASVERT